MRSASLVRTTPSPVDDQEDAPASLRDCVRMTGRDDIDLSRAHLHDATTKVQVHLPIQNHFLAAATVEVTSADGKLNSR
jgi:hypothetical protein